MRHLVEHGELHPGLEVGRSISKLLEAALLLLLLLAHAVIQRRRTLRHTSCNADPEIMRPRVENKQHIYLYQLFSSNILADIPQPQLYCLFPQSNFLLIFSKTSPVLTAEHSVESAPPHAVQSDRGALGESAGSEPGRHSSVGGHLVGGDWWSRQRLK